MSVPHRPDAVVFDVVETLFSLAPLTDEFVRHGLDASTTDVFFARLLRDAFALASMGEHRPFAELAAGSLAVVAPTLDGPGRDSVLTAFSTLPAHPDVAPAFERLTDAGIRVATLTNGSAATTSTLLRRNGLDRYVEAVISVDEVRAWKPQQAPYRYAADRLGVARGHVAMVAVHAWDVHGARSAGLLTGWAARLEGTWSPIFTPADVVGADLLEVVDGLLELPVTAS